MSPQVSALGPLQHFLADAHVGEVMVNGSGAVWIERAGALVATDAHLSAVEGSKR
jgi:Flp pilus assembly CpaF family ATPase